MNKTLHYLLMADHLSLQKQLMMSIKDTGLTPGQPKILDFLNEHDGAAQKDIAEVCCIEPATLTSVLLGMESKGLIIRKKLNGNRRTLYVFLTDKGKSITKRIADEFEKLEQSALLGLSEEQVHQLNVFLTQIFDNLNRNGDNSHV